MQLFVEKLCLFLCGNFTMFGDKKVVNLPIALTNIYPESSLEVVLVE